MTLEGDPYNRLMDSPAPFRAVAKLTGFERVVVELDLDWGGPPWPDHLYDFQVINITNRIECAFIFHKEMLEPTLGLAQQERYAKGDRLVFHPRR